MVWEVEQPPWEDSEVREVAWDQLWGFGALSRQRGHPHGYIWFSLQSFNLDGNVRRRAFQKNLLCVNMEDGCRSKNLRTGRLVSGLWEQFRNKQLGHSQWRLEGRPGLKWFPPRCSSTQMGAQVNSHQTTWWHKDDEDWKGISIFYHHQLWNNKSIHSFLPLGHCLWT